MERIPRYNTFWWILVRTIPEEMEKAFRDWVSIITPSVKEKLINIDGKRLRGLPNNFLHIVSAWSSEQGLTLAQVKTDKKSNEITAIPKLLDVIDIKGAIITIDAAGCQRNIVQKIIDDGGDYIIALKGNQGNLHAEAINLFNQLEDFVGNEDEVEGFDSDIDYDKGHGRIEERKTLVMNDLSWLDAKDLWKGLETIIVVISKRTIGDKTSEERRYYISSLSGNSQRLGKFIRAHWSVENSYHWVLDVVFAEDSSKVDIGHAAENLAVFRRLGLNILKQENSKKLSLAGKRRMAGWNDDYMSKLLEYISVKKI